MEATRTVLALAVTVFFAIAVTWAVLAIRAREGRRNADTAGRFKGPWRFGLERKPKPSARRRERR
jgi:hypothetical protein